MTLIERLQEAIQEFEQSATRLSNLMEQLDPKNSKPIGEKCKDAKHALGILIAAEKMASKDSVQA